MENRGTYLRVGALVVLASAALVGLVLFFGGARISSGRAFESYFGETVQGLEVGAAVKYRGVTLGQVTEIGLVSATYGEEVPEAQRNTLFRQVMVRYLIDVAKIGRATGITGGKHAPNTPVGGGGAPSSPAAAAAVVHAGIRPRCQRAC